MFGGGKAPPSPPGGQVDDEEVRKVWELQVNNLLSAHQLRGYAERESLQAALNSASFLQAASNNARQSAMQRRCVNCGAARFNLGNCEYCWST